MFSQLTENWLSVVSWDPKFPRRVPQKIYIWKPLSFWLSWILHRAGCHPKRRDDFGVFQTGFSICDKIHVCKISDRHSSFVSFRWFLNIHHLPMFCLVHPCIDRVCNAFASAATAEPLGSRRLLPGKTHESVAPVGWGHDTELFIFWWWSSSRPYAMVKSQMILLHTHIGSHIGVWWYWSHHHKNKEL